jgi:hypothetical protein
VVVDEETYETHYGLRDPMIDVLRWSYLHVWTIKGAHARFVTYAEHTAKCKVATILKWSSTTFYRWKQKEEENYAKSPDKDETGSVLRLRWTSGVPSQIPFSYPSTFPNGFSLISSRREVKCKTKTIRNRKLFFDYQKSKIIFRFLIWKLFF